MYITAKCKPVGIGWPNGRVSCYCADGSYALYCTVSALQAIVIPNNKLTAGGRGCAVWSILLVEKHIYIYWSRNTYKYILVENCMFLFLPQIRHFPVHKFFFLPYIYIYIYIMVYIYISFPWS